MLEPRTPTHPQTPTSISDAVQPSTPNKEMEFDAKRKNSASGLLPLSSSGPLIQQTAYPTHQTTVYSQTTIAPNQSTQVGLETIRTTYVQSHVSPYTSIASQDQVKPSTYSADKKGQPPHGYSTLVAKDERILSGNRPEWPSTQPAMLPLQPKGISHLSAQTSIQTSQSQLPRVNIVPEGSNPFSDVYQEMEKKAKAPGNVPDTQAEHSTYPTLPSQNQWKTTANRLEQLTPRAAQQQMHSTSALYYPSSSTSVHAVNDSMTVHQVKGTAALSQSQSLGSAVVSQSHSVAFALQNPHYTGQATLVTISNTTVINHSSELPAANSAETHLVPSNLQQHHWMQTTSAINQNVPAVSNSLSQQQQAHGLETQKTTSIMYPPQSGPPGSGNQQSLYSPHLHDRVTIANEAQTRNPGSGNQSHYPPNYNHQAQSSAVSTQQSETTVTSYIGNGDPSVKDNAKPVQKRQKSATSSHMSSGSVDFSLLSPEEQKTFILERKREDFERRRRLLEEQRQMRDQENQRGLSKKIDKKAPKAKQQRRLKGVREKEPVEKPTVQTLLVLEDKSMKLPLCEPEVHLLYPLVQPFGSGYLNGDKLILGAFGNAILQGELDYYSQFPSPNPPVTSSNPPTPPSSLPPSPGTINQSLRDSLQMIPTEGIFDDMPQNSDINRTLHLHEQKVEKEGDAQKDSKDNVLVTLIMTGNNPKVPNDRVSYVTDVLGVAKPETIQVVDESNEQLANGSTIERPQATSVGRERDVHYGCLDNVKPRSGSDSKGPFCKHCDISIQGTGYVECKGNYVRSPSQTVITVGNSSFEKVKITTTLPSSAFCSELCLNSYYSLSQSKHTSDILSQQETFADDSGQFIDPVRSVIPVSTGEPSNSEYFGSNIEGQGIRGDLQVTSPSLALIKRKIPEDNEVSFIQYYY